MRLSVPGGVSPERYRVPELRDLLTALTPLSATHQVAFAVACSQRLYPGYARHVAAESLPDVLAPLLPQLWKHVLSVPIEPTQARREGEALLHLSLGDDASATHADAVDALSAVYATLQACEAPSPHHAVTAGEAVINCADFHAQLLIDPTSSISSFTPAFEAQIGAHPVVLEAKAFLRHVLDVLGARLLTDDVVRLLRERANAA